MNGYLVGLILAGALTVSSWGSFSLLEVAPVRTQDFSQLTVQTDIQPSEFKCLLQCTVSPE